MDVCMFQKPRLKPLFIVTASFSAFASQAGLALDGNFEIGTAVEHSSNVLRVNDNEQSDTLTSLLANANLHHSGDALDAKLLYSFEKRHYQDGSYDDENVTEGTANIDWRVLDDRISLLVDHTISDSIVNSGQANTPDNRTQRSVLSAGPRFRLHLSQVDDVELTTRHTDVHVDTFDESDSKRDEASLRWNRRLPQLRNFYITTNYADVNFPDQENQDYKFTAAAIGFSSVAPLGTLLAEVGTNRADRDVGEDVTGESVNINWTSRNERSPMHWSIGYISAITDSSLGLTGQSSLPSAGNGASSNLSVVDIIKRDEFSLNISTLLNPINTTVSLTASEEKQDYEQTPNDDRIDQTELRLQHPVTPRASVYIYANKTRQDFLDTDEDLADTEVGVGGSYLIVQSLNLHWSAYRLKRDHSIDALSFTDNVYRLELTYGFGFGASATKPGATSTSATAGL